jgi:hypothetical protein
VHRNDGIVELVDEILFEDFVVPVTDFHDGDQHDQVSINHVETHLIKELDEAEGLQVDTALVLLDCHAP